MTAVQYLSPQWGRWKDRWLLNAMGLIYPGMRMRVIIGKANALVKRALVLIRFFSDSLAVKDHRAIAPRLLGRVHGLVRAADHVIQ